MNRYPKLSDRFLASLTPEERSKLALQALARDDDNELDRLFRMCPRRFYSALDSKFINIWDQTWQAAYHFRDAVLLLDIGRTIGERQALLALDNVLGRGSSEAVIKRLKYLNEIVREAKLPELSTPVDLPGENYTGSAQNESTESQLRNAFAEYWLSIGGLVAGFQLFAHRLGLTLHEVLAPLPEHDKNRLLDLIESIPSWVTVPNDIVEGMALLFSNSPQDNNELDDR